MNVQTAIDRLRAGQRIIASDAMLEAISDQFSDDANLIRSARNRNRCGVLDAYVCWMADEATPADLEFKNGYAVASV